jgi:prophage antirepressor-like protein
MDLEVQVLELDGFHLKRFWLAEEPYIVAQDACRYLGQSDYLKAIKDYAQPTEKKIVQAKTEELPSKFWVLTASGLHRIVQESKKPFASTLLNALDDTTQKTSVSGNVKRVALATDVQEVQNATQADEAEAIALESPDSPHQQATEPTKTAEDLGKILDQVGVFGKARIDSMIAVLKILLQDF